jgi:hypothetical protein
MRMIVLTACIAAAAASPAEARLVGPGFDKSWGKAGVSLEQYRADAIACGREAAAIDLAGSGPAKSLVIASRMLDNNPTLETAGVAMWIASPERNFAKAGDIMHARLDRCLTDHGYREFKLSTEQRHRLRRLPVGSLERHTYLHRLASDPTILASQAID